MSDINKGEDLKIIEELILTRKTDSLEIKLDQENKDQYQTTYKEFKDGIDLSSLLSSNSIFDRNRRTSDFGIDEDESRSEEIDDLVRRDMIIKSYQ